MWHKVRKLSCHSVPCACAYVAIQLAVLSEHQLYVQGVTWDPIGCYLATMSSDKFVTDLTLGFCSSNVIVCRQMRLYTTSNYQLHSTVGRMTLPCGDHVSLQLVKHMGIFMFCFVQYARISFHDETISSFFRRLSFSPDGSILVVPGRNVVKLLLV